MRLAPPLPRASHKPGTGVHFDVAKWNEERVVCERNRDPIRTITPAGVLRL